MADVIPIHKRAQSADEHARDETERKRALFSWADGVLDDLGYTKAVTDARSLLHLRAMARRQLSTMLSILRTVRIGWTILRM
jgi:hypothetical protein